MSWGIQHVHLSRIPLLTGIPFLSLCVTAKRHRRLQSFPLFLPSAAMWRNVASAASRRLNQLALRGSILAVRGAAGIPAPCRRSYTWGVRDDGESTVPLWPMTNAASAPAAPTTVSSMLRAFTSKMLAAKRCSMQPRYRAVVLLHADPAQMSPGYRDLKESTEALATLLRLPCYALSAEAPLTQPSSARLLSPADGSEATLRDAAASQRRWPQFLIVVTRDGVSVQQLSHSGNWANPTLLLAGGKVHTDLRRFKKAGTHGFDERSPIVRACIEGIRLPAVASQGPLRVLDVTMGLGADSTLLASFHIFNRVGVSVCMLEQDAVLALLMLDALTRLQNQLLEAEAAAAAQSSQPIPQWVGVSRALLSRLSLRFGCAESFFKETWPLLPVDQIPECVYADPFYPDNDPSKLAAKDDASVDHPKSASKSKKEMELARLLWGQTRTLYPNEVDEITIARAAAAGTTPSVPFFATPTNVALRSLLESAFAVLSGASASSLPASAPPRVVLKHPSSPFARRLLTILGFDCVRTFESRDTCFHIMGKQQADASSPAEPVHSNPKPRSAQPKQKGGNGKQNAKSKPNNPGARSFHSVTARFSFTSPPSLPSPPVCDSYTFRPLGVVRSCFPDRFSIPRQGCLAPSATSVLTLEPEALERFTQTAPTNSAAGSSSADWARSVSGLEDFSHLWIIFVFHDNIKHAPAAAMPDDASPAVSAVNIGWRQTARPPRLGGKEEVGVFASRSPYRPNPIGMSLVQLERVVIEAPTATAGRRVHLHLRGVDLLDGTPIIDIKPWIPYCDMPAAASASDALAAVSGSSLLPSVRLGWATEPVRRFQVRVTEEVRERIAQAQVEIDARVASDAGLPRVSLLDLLCDLLSLDARHGHQQSAHPAVPQATSVAYPQLSSAPCASSSSSAAGRRYGLRVLDYNFDYSVQSEGGFEVDHMESIEEYRANKEQRKKARENAAATAAAAGRDS